MTLTANEYRDGVAALYTDSLAERVSTFVADVLCANDANGCEEVANALLHLAGFVRMQGVAKSNRLAGRINRALFEEARAESYYVQLPPNWKV